MTDVRKWWSMACWVYLVSVGLINRFPSTTLPWEKKWTRNFFEPCCDQGSENHESCTISFSFIIIAVVYITLIDNVILLIFLKRYFVDLILWNLHIGVYFARLLAAVLGWNRWMTSKITTTLDIPHLVLCAPEYSLRHVCWVYTSLKPTTLSFKRRLRVGFLW